MPARCGSLSYAHVGEPPSRGSRAPTCQASFKRLSDADIDRLKKKGGEMVEVREGHESMAS